MDMYGFYNAVNTVCPYQYNQTDEQQAMAASAPFSPGMNNLPVAGSPWNSRGLAWGMQSPPQVVQFTGQLPVFKDEKASLLHCKQCKRKSLDDIPTVPAKQLITEEKMAAHLNSLHLSSDYTPHSAAESMDVMMDTRDGEALSEKAKGHTILLSEEVKRIREEPILPAVLIERLEKPSMSLVVWKPRENILEQIKEDSKPDEEEPRKRNGVLVDNMNNDVDMWSSGSDKWNVGGNGSCM